MLAYSIRKSCLLTYLSKLRGRGDVTIGIRWNQGPVFVAVRFVAEINAFSESIKRGGTK
jgi:hypothetical protein